MGIVCSGDGVVMVYQLHLCLIDALAMLTYLFCPFAIDEGLVENSQVFLCCERVSADEVALCQSAYHAHVAVVVREDVCHHGGTLCEGHVAQGPVELVHVADDEHGRLGANLVECAEDVGRELHQVIGQFPPLCLHEVVEEDHLVCPLGGAFDRLNHLVVVAEVVFAVDGEVFLQYQVGLLYFSDLRRTEEEPCGQ